MAKELAIVLAAALTVKIVFLLLTANTYDYDEFVVLLLARDFAHGAWPYHSFMFFHPPGVLVVYRAVEWITAFWWPLGRLLPLLADAATAALVFRIGSLISSRRAGLCAAALYILSPLTLVSSVRIGQDPIITFFGVLGLYILLRYEGWRAASLAGVCLALAVWVKYPAIYFLPAYVLVIFFAAHAHRDSKHTQYIPTSSQILTALSHAAVLIVAALGVFMLLMLPFHADWHALYEQTVTFQRTRWSMPLDQRLATTGLFWLVMNPLAVVAVVNRQRPRWLAISFLLGGLFVFTSQVYYHYFVSVVPFAAVLGGVWLADRVPPETWRTMRARFLGLTTVTAVVVAGWAAILNLGGASPLYVTAAHLDSLAPTIDLIDSRTLASQSLLADRYEYAYLSNRPALAHYFWNVGPLIGAAYLEKRVSSAEVVVLSYGASSGFPPGFTDYLNSRYSRVLTPTNTIWLVHPFSARNNMHSG